MTTPIMLHVEPRFPKKRKWPWRVLWALLFLFCGSVGWWWWSYDSALAERDRMVAELRSRGEAITWDEFADKLLAERTANTGAELFLQAVWDLGGSLNQNGAKVPTAALEKGLEDERFKPAVRPVVQQELQLGAKAISVLEEAVKRPPGLLTTAIKTQDPIGILLPHIQDARALVRLLHWSANDALARKDAKTAYHAVALGLGASEQLSKEPFLISQLVRLAMRGQACETLAMCLGHAAVPDDEYRAIDKLLAAVDDGFGVEIAWQGERAMWMTVLDDPEMLKSFFNDFGNGRPGGNEFQQFMRNRWVELMASPVGRPVILRTQAAFLRLHETIGKTADVPSVDRAARKTAFEEFERDAPLKQMGLDIGQWGFQGLSTFDLGCAKAHRRNILARLALRLRRHYDKHGRFPEKLEDLCDADMPKLRLDWFENKPIVYKPSATGFRLEIPDALLSRVELDARKQNPNDPSTVIEVKIGEK